jgi:lipoprotein-anchoring transpeptidase ErfK/SrfK
MRQVTGRLPRRLGVAVAIAGLVALAGCGARSPAGHGDNGGADSAPSATTSSTPAAEAPTATINSPADGATGVPAATEITFSTAKAQSATVTVTDGSGAPVDGGMRAEGSAWLPKEPLEYAKQYTAKVTATGADGAATTRTATFTTMRKPENLVSVRSQLGDDQVYGVGMPVMINFGTDIPQEQRATVERRLFVTSEPAQVGAWNWFNGHEVHYRPREYWQAGTKLSIRVATGGLPLGGGAYGARDLNVRAAIGDKFVMTVDNATKTMSVTRNDQEVRTMPVSLGKPSSPSSSGNMIVMVKNDWEWFDSSTYGVPVDAAGGYRTKVYWPQRLTWGGQYIHAAPWSEGEQGRVNVSHGCTNVSMGNADWLWHQTHVGDPVIVKGTERGLDWGDGWTDWNVNWEEYLKGSALPPPAEPASPVPAHGPAAS